MRYIICTIFLTVWSYTYSQTGFYSLYSNNGYDFGQGIVQLPDSSYYITGASSSYSQDHGTDAFILHIDSKGKFINSHHFGGIETDWANRIVWDKTKYFYLVGYSNSYGKSDYDGMIMKVDTAGNEIWNIPIGTSGWDKLNDALLLNDSSLIVVGQTNNNSAEDQDLFLARIKSTGETLWSKQIKHVGNDLITAVKANNDSTFYIAGTQFNADSSQQKALLIQLNLNGDTLWSHQYGNHGNYEINDFCIVDDHINLVGKQYDSISGKISGYLCRTDLNGIELYHFNSVINGDYAYSNVSTFAKKDKLYMSYEYKESGITYPDGKDLVFARYTETLLWDAHNTNISSYGDDISRQIISTLDSGIILVGYNSAFNSGGANVLVYKIGKDENFPSTIGTPTIQTLVKLNKVESTDFKLFPNPVKDKIHIESNETNFSGRILDFAGNEIQFFYTSTIDVSNLNQGIYIIEISSNSNSSFYKFVKE